MNFTAPNFSRKFSLIAALSLWALMGCQDQTQQTAPHASSTETSSLASAIAHPNRSDAHRARDGERHPEETLTFFGVAPDMYVIELSPGSGWYSEILARYLKEQGQFVAAHWDMNADLSEGYRRARGQYDEKFANVDEYGAVTIIPFNPPTTVNLGPAASADRVLSFRNMHSWHRSGALPSVFSAAFDVLKPGGVFGVVGHRLPENREQDPEARSGYMHQSLVVSVAEQAGFILEASSEINANPNDTADHPNGVWNLAPSLRVEEGDEKDYAAIGESDRFTLRFIKP